MDGFLSLKNASLGVPTLGVSYGPIDGRIRIFTYQQLAKLPAEARARAQGSAFTKEEMRLAESCGTHMGVILEHVRLFDDLKKSYDELHAWSVALPITPPRASTSRTTVPLAIPPMAGLQDIWPIVSRFWVSSRVRAPMRAESAAASAPAWPPPITMTSYRSGMRGMY